MVALRLSLLFAYLPLCLFLCGIAALFTRHNPVPRLFLGGAAFLFGLRIVRSGKLSERGAVLIANHVSWLDIPALSQATGSAFVAHDGLASSIAVRWLCSLNDTVFVARHDRRSVSQQVEQVRQAIRDTGALTIFPEGTTGDGSEPLPFKSSLLSAFEQLPEGVAVQPVWLDYGADAADIAWVGNEPGLRNALRILSRRKSIDLKVEVLPALEGTDLTSRKAIASAARNAICDALKRAR